jgi:hypothetical protein
VPGPAAPRPLAAEADRDRLVALLGEHYAQGLLGLAELDRRVGLVLAARYLDEAAVAVADLPALAAAPPAAGRQQAGQPRPRQPSPGSASGTRPPARSSGCGSTRRTRAATTSPSRTPDRARPGP